MISPRYRAWAVEQDDLPPTDAVIATRFGSWTAAMRRAGPQSDEQIRDRFRELEPDATERAFRGFVDAVPDPAR